LHRPAQDLQRDINGSYAKRQADIKGVGFEKSLLDFQPVNPPKSQIETY
jgi:hypothetical protein